MNTPRRDPRGARAVAAALLCAALTGCASDVVEDEGLHHYYKVVLLPVDVPASVLPDTPPDPAAEAEGDEWYYTEGVGNVPFALSRDELAQRIRDGLLESDVFSDVTALDRKALRSENTDEWVGEAGDTARAESADLILRVRVRSAEVTDVGPNENEWWSNFMWIMVPAPFWPIDDRDYETNIAVQAELFDPADPLRPKASVVAKSDKQSLDMWDRGWKSDWRLLVVPPSYRPGDPELVSEELTQRAVAQLIASLKEQLRTNVIPSIFEVDVALEGGKVVVTVTTPSTRKLRSLEVLVDDQLAKSWAELGTNEIRDARSTETDFVYKTPPVGLDSGKVVRVIATDETGGREVRTLRVGGRP